MDNSTSPTLRFVRINLLLISLEGLIAFLILLFQPSMQRNAILGGYSAARLALLVVMFGLVSLCGGITFFAWQKPHWVEKVHVWIYAFLAKDDRLAWLTAILGSGLMGTLLVLGVFTLPGGKTWLESFLSPFTPQPARWAGLFWAGWSRGFPVLIWSLLLCAHGLVYLRCFFQPIWQKSGRIGAWQRIVGLLILIGTAIFHWMILIFHLKTFILIPGWKWYFYDKGFSLFQPLFFIILILAGLVSLAVFRLQWRPGWKLALIILLGYTIQVGFGFLEGGGYESLRVKYADSVFNGYAMQAAREPALADVVLHYDENYGDDWYLGTKPPGVLLTYVAFEKISNAVMPLPTVEQRFVWLTRLAAYLFPLFSLFVLMVLYLFEKELTGSENNWTSALLFITLPSMLLIPLYLDQVIYPLIFMTILLFLLRAMRQQSWQLAVYCGIGIYLALFFSFSLLPLIPLSGLWVILDTIIHWKQTDKRKNLKLLLGLAVGFVMTYAVFRLKLNYDLIERYLNAMAAHRRAKAFEPGLEQILKAVWLNNAEFASFVGFPVIILFLTRVLISFKRWLKRQPKSSDGLLLAFLLTYAALNLMGQTNGEVQRLWLFLAPLVVLFSSRAMNKFFHKPQVGIIFLMEIQLITALLLMRFQDFYG